MCGIAGCLVADGAICGEAEITKLVQDMTSTLVHRGPDDNGHWIDRAARVGLGHRRLSILDLSQAGRQPMTSRSGRFTIVYNGEVYNYRALRQQLEQQGHTFRGGSDTEVILAALEQWPLEEAIQRFVGMFAIAVWDTEQQRLFLVRDRLGIKPLYYGWVGNDFVFASELKALRCHPKWKGAINRNALAQYMQHSSVPAPASIYAGIHKLPPATVLTLTLPNDRSTRAEISRGPAAYWSAASAFEAGRESVFRGTEEEAVEQLEVHLREAVATRMISDVPIGAFLSGGIDSSLIVALMQAQSSRQVKTFTIGFQEGFNDEAKYARAVAAHLGTKHTELYVTAEEAMQVIPRLPDLYDEPFADSSQIPTFLVSKLARSQVTVALSGDGGDELFAGYNRYFQAPRIWRACRMMPQAVRQRLAKLLVGTPASAYEPFIQRMKPFLPRLVTSRSPGNSVQKIAQVMSANSFAQIYEQLSSTWQPGELPVLGGEADRVSGWDSSWTNPDAAVRQMMLNDLLVYHPSDILTKVDRASMGVSLEARVPLIDHRIVEFSATLPLKMLIERGTGKKLLRRLLAKYVPTQLFE
ncbi:MAG: asparagine synthase (glutamine-hydrolyzing), partial [Bythopirellula sp.]